MRAIDRKLLRDLWHIKGQALAIAMVVAAGIAMLVMYLSTFASLQLTLDTYYDRYRFAEVFASLRRAPASLVDAISEIPGVAEVETRVVADVSLSVEGLSEPAVARLISVPERPSSHLNDLFLRQGRYLEPGRPDEVLVSEGFALARGLEPGDRVSAVLNGRRRSLEIVGIALSPEYVYTIRPGDLFPDDSRFGIFWMAQPALAAAFDMEGGFNDLSLSLMRDASEPEVIARLDRLLEPYGGLGAIPRSLQLSHWSVTNELAGLKGAGFIVPVVFLAVAIFLLNVVLTRIVSVQREQIAALKALGYSNFDIGLHFVKWSLLVTFGGAVLGILGGAWMGQEINRLYAQFFRFPILTYEVSASVVLVAVAVSAAAAVLGARSAVLRAIRLPPAEAMRPEPPANFRRTWVERMGLGHWLSEPSRMILRNLQRQPLRAAFSVIGISFAGAVMVVGTFSLDAIDWMLDLQFNVSQRQDLTVSFYLPASSRAFHEIERLEGVLTVEPMRSVPVRLRAGHRSRNLAIQGFVAQPELSRVVRADYRPVHLPAEGLVMSAKLAELMDIEVGDEVRLEVLDGSRPVVRAQVAQLVDEFMGTAIYMEIGALRRLLHEGDSLSGVTLKVDPRSFEELYRRLKATPAVAAVALKRAVLQNFEETIGRNLGLLTFFNILFASIIAIGVIYNSARISLSERGRDLASLRVLGFTRGEISFILLGELALLTAISLPLGLALGRGLAALTVRAYDNELYRLPMIVAPRTYGIAALTVVLASLLSGLVVRRRLDHLDLVAVLKTRE